MNTIKLNLINETNSPDVLQVIVFQKNSAMPDDYTSVVWRVIKDCGPGDHHRFSYSPQLFVASSDSWGNYSPKIPAKPGDAFMVIATPSGDMPMLTGVAGLPDEIDVINGLPVSGISASIYRDGLLLAVKTNVLPGQKATFSFGVTIWMGVVSQVVEGQVMNAAILADGNGELNLTGIQSADIIMTGGGPGPNATPFVYTLANITYA